MVQAPSGAGKTTGVAGWARNAAPFDAVVWLPADALAHDVHRFWGNLSSALIRSGCPLAPLPSAGGDGSEWTGWISAAATALVDLGRRWLIVLDDFPVGPPGCLGDQITSLAIQAGHNLHVIITASSAPAIDPRQVLVAGRYAHIGPDRLEMDGDEVAAVLGAGGLPVSARTVSSVTARTFGWARGIALAKRMLSVPPNDQLGDDPDRFADACLAELDRVLDGIVDREVLSVLLPADRELVIRTSVSVEVTATLARAMLGPGVPGPGDRVVCRNGFVDHRPDGSFQCHPLLRRCARHRLDTEWPALARSARRAAAEWHLAAGRRSESIALAAQVDDSTWLAELLIASFAVPAIMLGASQNLPLDPFQWSAVERAEPLLAAAAATARGDVAAAEVALTNARDGVAADPTRRLSEQMIRMALARRRADHESGLGCVETCRDLVAELASTGDAAPELSVMLDVHKAVFLLWRGDLEASIAILGAGCELAGATPAEGLVAAERVGVSAWLQALHGNLTMASRQAALVLTARTADRDETGVGYAQLAAAWVHLERGELDQAQQRLGHATRLDHRECEPWLVAARCLTEARLATVGGDPDVALRLLDGATRSSAAATGGWLADRLRVAVAEAHLVAGDPQRALATLTPEPRHTVVEARVVATAARRAVGDRRGAQALLAGVEGRLASAPLPSAVRAWSLGAQLACDSDDPGRARLLIERALRAADREDLRLALSQVGPWLSAFLDRDPELLRRYRGLITAARRAGASARTAESAARPGGLTESLTERELQVLERLAQLSTTEEIAADLYVTANTVKTHTKKLFLKLAVNRRSDAVRRGRQLGLC